ncbi:sulfotransferase family 2 domain-containing protein [Neiella sp. HB171785]|uniref:Sulfotransferase family 2 domain-containing protein n=1 Tax=Neiella litorisoli TaxID=2771431 RepID=A0A8J6UPQ0_9GAMM|nr:sulfotransferase family 2 domain-containing protein [Neiella litorisoli]MBD1389087.1 sulfotransferase family 2 domain-containing protein [Neiella litorisoli]
MLLSHKHNFLFVHIAKTGGTSVRTALSKYRWGHKYSLPQFICSKLSQMTGHHIGSKFPRHSKVIAAKEMLPGDYFDQLYKFVFVRNPWDLQVSSFHHIKRERPKVMAGRDDFETFLKWKFDPERPYQYHIDTSIELQTDYLVDLHGNVIVDFIGHYESLQQDFNSVCDQLKLPTIELPHKRKATDRKTYRDYYTDETAELVAKHFQRDIDILGYTFD